MKTYRVAILGCRGRGTAAARAYHAHPRTQVVGLADLVQERLDTLGDELGVSARYLDLDAMIQQTQPDIVAIPTGTEFHYELAMRVLEYGVHIDIEKPLCVDVEQADKVVAKAKEKGVRIAVHHQGRTGAHMQALTKHLTAGHLGEIRYLNGNGKSYYGGLGLMNIGTHMINNMLKIAGHCRGVSATALTDGHLISPADVVPSPLGMGTIAGEHITATLDFASGITATLRQHRAPAATTPIVEVWGTEGRLVWNQCLLIKGGVWFLPQAQYTPEVPAEQWQRLEPILPPHFDPNSPAAPDDYCFADEYVQALDQNREHECNGTEGLHVVEIMMGIFESAAYGHRVDLPQPQRQHPLLRWRQEHNLDTPAPMPRDYNEWLAAEDLRLGRNAS